MPSVTLMSGPSTWKPYSWNWSAMASRPIAMIGYQLTRNTRNPAHSDPTWVEPVIPRRRREICRKLSCSSTSVSSTSASASLPRDWLENGDVDMWFLFSPAGQFPTPAVNRKKLTYQADSPIR